MKCLNCGCELGACDPRIYCSRDCLEEREVVDMDLSQVPTMDLVDALMERDDVRYITNEKSSKTCVAMIEGGNLIVEDGEHIILIVKGLY